MNKIKEFLGGLMGGLLGVVFMIFFVFGDVYGIYHAFTKHNAGLGVMSIFLPPVAYYMLAEGLIWHDDFSSVDWELRLKNDVKAVAHLIARAPNIGPTEMQDYNKAIEGIAKEFKDYPNEKKLYLEQFGFVFIAYSQSLMDDLMVNFEDAVMDGGSLEIKESSNTSALEKKLLAYPGTDQIVGEFKLALYALGEKSQGSNLKKLPEKLKEQTLKIMFLKNKTVLSKMESAYNDIFSKPIPSRT